MRNLLKSGKWKTLLIVGALLTFLAFIAGGVIFTYYFRAFSIPTPSMANTIIPGDQVLCFMQVGKVKRGDIVVYRLPEDPKLVHLHRVIGLPGETIQLRGDRVLINGAEIAEARTAVELMDGQTPPRELASEGAGPYRVYYSKRDEMSVDSSEMWKYAGKEPYLIPTGHYFLLGDCRDNSFDSRYFGPIPRDKLVGTAMIIIDSKDPDRIHRSLR